MKRLKSYGGGDNMTDFQKDKRKKKKKSSFFEEDDFFGGGDFNQISKMMNEMMRRAFSGSISIKPLKTNKPMVYGFSMKMGPGGQPRFEEFGNIAPGQKKVKQKREPLVDVIDKQKEVTIIAELPGVEKKEINVTVSDAGKKLTIDVPKKFFKEIILPSKVKDTADAHYKNGILEVNLKKIKPSKPKKKKIKIE